MSKNRVLILKSLAANYPILKSWGLVFPRLLTLVISAEGATRVIEALINFPENLYDTTQTKNSDFVFHLLRTDGKNQVLLDKICRNHQLDFKGNQGLSVVITGNLIAGEDDRNYFYVFLEEETTTEEIDIDELVPDTRELRTIYKNIHAERDEVLTEEERILRAAVYFLEPYLYRSGSHIKTEELLELAHSLCVLDEEARDSQDLENLFLKTLYTWQSQNDFGKVFEMFEEDLKREDIQNVVLVDESFVYLGEKLFKQMIAPLLAIIPINTLKKKLLDEGFIDTGSNCTATYTVKVGIWLENSEYKRVRVLRFKRDKLEIPGELGFVDRCWISRDGGAC